MIRKTIYFCYGKNETKRMNTLCRQNAELLNVAVDGVYSNHSALNLMLRYIRHSDMLFNSVLINLTSFVTPYTRYVKVACASFSLTVQYCSLVAVFFCLLLPVYLTAFVGHISQHCRVQSNPDSVPLFVHRSL